MFYAKRGRVRGCSGTDREALHRMFHTHATHVPGIP